MALLHADGCFGADIAAAASRTDWPDDLCIIAADFFDPHRAAHLLADAAMPAVLCFPTQRGLFVSCRLGIAAPCLQCFERRWLANILRWEHSAEQERQLLAVGRQIPAARAFAQPPSAIRIAVTLLAQRGTESADTALCDYVDLLSGQRMTGRLFPVHGCQTCFPDRSPLDRHMAGLAQLARAMGPADG